MVLSHTVGIHTTGEGGAGIGALIVDAGQLPGTVGVFLTFSFSCSNTARGVGISLGSPGTDTLVGAWFVQTESSIFAGIVLALVQIFTTRQWISSVALLTQTLGWVGWRTLRIETAFESVTRTFTLIAIQIVQEERW